MHHLNKILDLDDHLHCTQHGFRKGLSCQTQLCATFNYLDKSIDDGHTTHALVMDFKKAFDSVTHRSLWRSLLQQGVPDGYINLLDKLYTDQVGVVRTDRFSKEFNIEKGVKQGDPLSSLLFNCAAEQLMRTVKQRWRGKGHGVALKPNDERLTNLRFADDILLITQSLPSTTEMISDLSIEARNIGLHLHS